MINKIEIYLNDCISFLKTLTTGSVKAVIIDPPYTDGKGNDCLKKHKIQTVLDIPLIISEINRVCAKDSYFCFFGQFPTVVTWYMESEKYFNYAEHIVWAKRMLSSPYHKIVRTHEELFIFRKGTPKWNETTQDFADIKVPSVPLGLYQNDSFFRRLTKFKEVKTAIFANETIENIKKMFLHKPGSKTNEKIYDAFKNDWSDGFPTESNISNTWAFELTQKEFDSVWSFASQNKTSYGKNGENHKHPTTKPIKLLEQLIKLCTFEGELVVDCFLGSGTTAVSCANTNRNFKGCELDKDYHEMSMARVNSAIELNKYKQTKIF